MASFRSSVGRRFRRITRGAAATCSRGWITDPKNPLTARVMVNRVWLWHFGRGLVNTPNDFGKRGETPTHPELLDYLPSRFMESGWSLKKLHQANRADTSLRDGVRRQRGERGEGCEE